GLAVRRLKESGIVADRTGIRIRREQEEVVRQALGGRQHQRVVVARRPGIADGDLLIELKLLLQRRLLRRVGRRGDLLLERADGAAAVAVDLLLSKALPRERAVGDVDWNRLVVPAVVGEELAAPLARKIPDRADARRPVVVDADLDGAVEVRDLLPLPADAGV